MLDKSLDQSFNSSYGQDHLTFGRISESDEPNIVNNDGGDSLSDDSDDTSCSTWKQPPPPDKRTHRYLDEMRVSERAGGCNLHTMKLCAEKDIFWSGLGTF